MIPSLIHFHMTTYGTGMPVLVKNKLAPGLNELNRVISKNIFSGSVDLSSGSCCCFIPNINKLFIKTGTKITNLIHFVHRSIAVRKISRRDGVFEDYIVEQTLLLQFY